MWIWLHHLACESYSFSSHLFTFSFPNEVSHDRSCRIFCCINKLDKCHYLFMITATPKHNCNHFRSFIIIAAQDDANGECQLCVLTHSQHSALSQSCCCTSNLRFWGDLSSSCCFTPTSSQSWPFGIFWWLEWASSQGASDTNSSLGGKSSVSLSPPSKTLTRSVPLCSCFLSLLLIVFMSGCRGSTWWRVTFGWSDACSLSLWIGLEIGQQKRSPDVSCKAWREAMSWCLQSQSQWSCRPY